MTDLTEEDSEKMSERLFKVIIIGDPTGMSLCIFEFNLVFVLKSE